MNGEILTSDMRNQVPNAGGESRRDADLQHQSYSPTESIVNLLLWSDVLHQASTFSASAVSRRRRWKP
jgi:hypothetical protein